MVLRGSLEEAANCVTTSQPHAKHHEKMLVLAFENAQSPEIKMYNLRSNDTFQIFSVNSFKYF